MAPRNRALFALVGLISAIAAGCSGNKTSGARPPTASASPTSIASGVGPITAPSGVSSPSASSTPFVLRTATPVPAATAAPSGNPLAVATRPLANGDAFAYAGTTAQSFVYAGTSPNPSASSVFTVRQNVAVLTGKSFAGVANLDQFTTTETDTSPRQTTTVTTNAYYGLTAGPTTNGVSQTALTTYGSSSTDSNGQSLATTIANPGYANNSGTVDLLPESRAPTWTNGTAETIVQNESDGFSATRTYNADGSYTESATYPQTSAASPQPASLTATITQNKDGSGVYNLPLFSPPNTTINFAAPTSAGLIVISFKDSTGAVVDTEMSGAWFAQPLALYSEIDRDNGAVPYPSACNVPTTYGTQGNEVEQKFTRTDTILGTLEFFDQLTFVASNGVAACVQLSDVTYVFYDYSGQTNTNVGVGFGSANSPYETQTVATTLGITGSTLNSIARSNDRAHAVTAPAVANARANFLITVDRYRLQRERKMFAQLRTAFTRFRR